MRLAFVFRSSPHTTSRGREGLDALLAASAYCDDIDVFFIGKGVTQLMPNQQPRHCLSRDYAAAFKLLSLYDIDNIYTCQQSLEEFGLDANGLLIESSALSNEEITQKLHLCHKILTF